MLSIYGLDCLDHVYTNMVDFYQETSLNSSAAESGSTFKILTLTISI